MSLLPAGPAEIVTSVVVPHESPSCHQWSVENRTR
jgi:hypothetical protein